MGKYFKYDRAAKMMRKAINDLDEAGLDDDDLRETVQEYRKVVYLNEKQTSRIYSFFFNVLVRVFMGSYLLFDVTRNLFKIVFHRR